jgi:hypothetical protein
VTGSGASSGGERPDPLVARGEREVVAFHEFLDGWLSGRASRDEERFAAETAALADGFRIVSPDGEERDRAAVVEDLRAGHGASGEGFRIRVERVRERWVAPGGDACLLAYEEWQETDGGETARASTVLLRREPAAPRGVAWLDLHETWLPGAAPG